MRCVLIYVWVVVCCPWAAAQTDIPDIGLRDIDNHWFTTITSGQQPATVIVFVNHECPITQQYLPLLAELYKRYQSVGVAFYGVFPPYGYKGDEVKQFRDVYQIPFPLLLDTKRGKLTHWLQAVSTPEVFLLDSTGAILYRGAIDNQFYALGKRRAQVTEHYLTDALEAKLSNAEIRVKQTKPLGCLIEVNHR